MMRIPVSLNALSYLIRMFFARVQFPSCRGSLRFIMLICALRDAGREQMRIFIATLAGETRFAMFFANIVR